MRQIRIWIAAIGVFAFGVADAHAWLRAPVEDLDLVNRSELIVVAHLKAGGIKRIDHKKKPGQGASWEHHATLVITEVLKGKCNQKEIPVIIHYGLTPGITPKKSNAPGSTSVIEIFDTGSLGGPGLPAMDAGKDNLWFLRKRSGTFGRKPGNGDYGIVDPEDLQPLKWKDYYLAYMKKDPAQAVEAYVEKHPQAAAKAKRYLDHLKIQRILKIKNPAERFEKLLPFYFARATWNMKSEARAGMLGCGSMAAKTLKLMFKNPQYKNKRCDILCMWRDMNYTQISPFLIELLKEHDRYWAAQKLEKGWWNNNVDSELTRRRRDRYGEVYDAVLALEKFKDPKAREALIQTRDHWKAIHFENTQIVEACEKALSAIGKKE